MTSGITFNDHLLTRLEHRPDCSHSPVFPRGPADTGKSQDTGTLLSAGSLIIATRMCRIVRVQGGLRLLLVAIAEEIQDVIVDCDLAAELQPKASVSQPIPKRLFSVGSPTLPCLLPLDRSGHPVS